MYQDKPVLQKFINWLDENKIQYVVDDDLVKLNDFSVRCIEANNSSTVSINPGEKLISAQTVDRDIERVASWITKKPTLRIEKMNIKMRDEHPFRYIEGYSKLTGELVVSSQFVNYIDFYCWTEINYITNFVPGWLSKCMSMLKDKPIYAFSVTEDNAFIKLGFKTLGKCTAVEMWEFLRANVEKRIRESVYDNPEKIEMWKLVYDNISTI